MLTVHHLSKSFDHQLLFKNVTFSLDSGERSGLIGVNGSGKTTLLRILAGEESPDSGHVRRAPDLRIGYLRQGFELDDLATIGEVVGRAIGSIDSLEDELARAAQALAKRPQDTGLQQRYDQLLQRISRAETGKAAAILAGLGLDEIADDTPCARLSGGQKTRLMLALVLLGDPELLLLDEPTNHLDIAMLEWLEDWLVSCGCAALIVSHDRTFLDRTVSRILDLDIQKHTLSEYAGNYSAYLEQRTREVEKQWADYHDQQLEIQRMQRDIARVKAQASYTERQASSVRIGGSEMKNKGFKDYQRSIAKKVARKAKSREKKLERFLESDELAEKPRRAWQMKLEFGEVKRLGKAVLSMQDLSVGYLPQAPLLSHLNLSVRAGQRIVLTGPNGSGKTTLLRTLAGKIPPLDGNLRLSPSVRLGYLTQDQSSLDPELTPLDTIQPAFPNQTEARSFLAYFLFIGDEALKPNALLSYGQRARLMLAQLVADQCNFLLLDEPINHLDIPSRAQFEQALQQFEGTVLAVVHDRYFIERFASEIWWAEGGRIRV